MPAKPATKSIGWFVKSCLADKGYAESPLGSNRTKYGKTFGWDGVAWCAIYGWCKLAAAGVVLPIKSASCVAIYDWAVKNGYHYNSTSCVPGDAVIRTWQRLARNARGFNAAETHYQEVLEIDYRDFGAKWLGLWGGNQGAGYVGPDLDWVKAGDATILGGLAWHRLFNAPNPVAAPKHDPAVDVKAGLPKAKSHPNIGKPATTEATDLNRRLKGKQITQNLHKWRALRHRITAAIKAGKKAGK